MTGPNSESSPRDHAADSDTELARKRQRLGEPLTPLLDDTIIVEADEPEDIGASLIDSITVDDESPVMLSYTASFSPLLNDESAEDQILQLRAGLRERRYLSKKLLVNLAHWLTDHLDCTRLHRRYWAQHYVEQENRFFALFADVIVEFLDRPDPIDPKEGVPGHGAEVAFRRLLDGLTVLTTRILPLLPDALRAIVSRRDSVQPSHKQYNLPLLGYVSLAARLLCDETAAILYFNTATSFDATGALMSNSAALFRSSILHSIVEIARTLSIFHRDFKDSWVILNDAFLITGYACHFRQHVSSYPRSIAEDMLDMLNATIMPIIREKHPRALPDRCHRVMFLFGRTAIQTLVANHDHAHASRIYTSYVKGEDDALLVESSTEKNPQKLLFAKSEQDICSLAKLMTTSWCLQEANGLVRSGVMEVRNMGLELYNELLQDIFNDAQADPDFFECRIIQYAIRFLRMNNVVKYIFGAESHATLVINSRSLLRFLSATGSYTNIESEVIWQACVTSVEADFVKSAFGVLESVLNDLDVSHLLFLVRLYHHTPVDRLGTDAASFLRRLFHYIEVRISRSTDPADRLPVVIANIEILRMLQRARSSPTASALRCVAQTEMARLCLPTFPSVIRQQICKQCIPDITNQTDAATVAVEMLYQVISHAPPDEKDFILEMLPVPVAVAELGAFVSRWRSDPNNVSVIIEVNARLMFIVQLIDVAKSAPDIKTKEALFYHVFGEGALCNPARNESLDRINNMATLNKISAASELLRDYLESYVTTISPDIATPTLIRLMAMHIASSCERHIMNGQQLLASASWKTLLRFVQTSRDPIVVQSAKSAFLDLLFSDAVDKIDHCRTEFVCTLIQDISDAYQRLNSEVDNDNTIQKISQSLDLLDSVLFAGKKKVSSSDEQNKKTLVLDASANNNGENIVISTRIQGPADRAEHLMVQITASSTLAQLQSTITERTGALSHKIILDGHDISKRPDEANLLADLGFAESKIVYVTPLWSFSFNLPYMFNGLDEMEQQILRQYDLLEKLLDGPDGVAHKAFCLLGHLPPPAHVRRAVATCVDSADAFPASKKWRSLFSMHVLVRHLHDATQHNITNSEYMLHSTQLLASYLADETRRSDHELIYTACSSLQAFLKERPFEFERLAYFKNGPSFVNRLVDLLLGTRGKPTGLAPFSISSRSWRTNAALSIYSLLTEIFATDESMWQAFESSGRMENLHVALLLDSDHDFAGHLAVFLVDFFNTQVCSDHVLQCYWNALLAGLPRALSGDARSRHYLDLLSKLLAKQPWIYKDVAQMNDLISVLSDRLFLQNHTEDTTLVVPDTVMSGLLSLLKEAIDLVPPRDLSVDKLSIKITEQLLFPIMGDTHPLVHKHTRNIAYEIVDCVCRPNDVQSLMEIICRAAAIVPIATTQYFIGQDIRTVNLCAGLTNLGMTCYMNSLLQQLFGNLPFRKFLLELPTERSSSLLSKVQVLFAEMQDSNHLSVNTSDLAVALDVQVGNQEDVHGFYAILMARLEESMPDIQSKTALSRFFSGRSITQIRGECGHVSSRVEPFSDLSITVKNKSSLRESLDEFVQGEPMVGANKYKCMTCSPDDGGRLVNALRRTCLEEVPPNLTFCLKRFTFGFGLDGENKVNDRFEFPAEIDMALYTRNYLENAESEEPCRSDVFELVGVIVHQGSLAFGHYWSYVRLPDALLRGQHAWWYLEDTSVCLCAGGVTEVQEQCFGGGRYPNGHERVDNAYVLFYQRKSYVQEASLAAAQDYFLPGEFNLPRLKLPASLSDPILKDNQLSQHIAFFFDERFAELVKSILTIVTDYRDDWRDPTPDLLHSGPSDRHGTQVETAARFIIDYTCKVLASDPRGAAKVQGFMDTFRRLIDTVPQIAFEMLQIYARDNTWLRAVMLHDDGRYQSYMTDMLERSIRTVQEFLPSRYEELLLGLIEMHYALLVDAPRALLDRLEGYFDFANRIAAFGVHETAALLDVGYLHWVLDVLNNAHAPQNLRKSYPAISAWMVTCKPDLSPFFTFLHAVLSQHVDLTDVDSVLDDSEVRCKPTDAKLQLKKSEFDRLFARTFDKKGNSLKICTVATMFCRHTEKKSWQEFPPGQLLGFLTSTAVDRKIISSIEQSLILRYEQEQYELDPLLIVTLHVCKAREDEDVRGLLSMFASQLILWNEFESRILAFWGIAHELSPISVTESLPTWVPEFLKGKRAEHRRATTEWLRERIFEPTPLSDHPAVDAARVRATRKIVDACMPTLERVHSRRDEGKKSFFKPMVDAMSAAGVYLDKLHVAILPRKHDSDAEGTGILSRELLIEFDEAARVKRKFQHMWDYLSEWANEPGNLPIPTRFATDREGLIFAGDESDLMETDYSEAESEDVSP